MLKPVFFLLLITNITLAQKVEFSVPELSIPATVEQWQSQRNTIRKTLVEVLGDLPPRPKTTTVKILSREDKGTYVLEKFELNNEAGAIVPGYFLTPKNGKSKHPAIYYCHWHGGNYDLGKNELFSTHHTPEVPADVLTKLGYAVIAIDTYCFGERSGRGPGGPDEKGSGEEMTTSKYELWRGRSLWGMMVRDDLMALEYLFSRPDIDTKRVAVTGISMGATRSWWMMAMDDRIKTGVAVGCLTRYQELISEQKLKYHGIYYFVPGLLKHFDTEAVISLIAPRPVLFMTGDEDPGSPVSGILKIDEVLKRVYKLHGVPDNFQNRIYPKTAHVYTPDMWANMIHWMSVKLK